MSQIPRDKSLDSTLALLSGGYTFIWKRCQRYQSDISETRLMFRKAVCVTGEEAARMFYHPDRFTRKGAMPPTALMPLQDKGSVQLLDGDAHRWRKRMFMSLMIPESVRQLVDMAAEQWRAHVEKLETMQRILCRAVCKWGGVPLTESEASEQRGA
jgi:fatty-acid peroxygenase